MLVSDLISECQQHLTIIGQRVSDADFLLYANRANKHFMTGYKMPTTERQSDLLLFTGVYEYPLPSDFIGIMQPRKPYGNFSPTFENQTPRTIARDLSGKKTGIKFDRETPFLIVQDDEGNKANLHDCSSLTDNGTWSVSGDGSSLVLDEQIFTEGNSSLRFTITGSGGTTTLVNSTITSPVDITDYLTQGWAFLDLQCPSGNTTALTSVRLRIGSDASNYYEIMATTRHRSNTILGGWGLVGFDMSTKTTTGTPTDTAIDYIQVLITHGTSGINGTYRLDNIFLSLPTYYQLPYYSKNNIKSDTSVYQESITETGDTILCPVEFNEAYVYKVLEIAATERIRDAALANYWRGELMPKEKALKSAYPNQQSRPQYKWYPRADKF